MFKDMNDIIVELFQNTQKLQEHDQKVDQDINNLVKEIQAMQNTIQSVSEKMDDILDLLNTLTIFIEDNENITDDEDGDANDSNEGWLPEISDWEHYYNSDDDDEDEDNF